MSVIVKDLGMARLKAQIALLAESQVTLGYQGESAAAQHTDTGATVGEVAHMMEYGTDDVPARPFLRTAMERRGDDLDKQLRRGVSDLVDMRADDADEILRNVGEAGVEAIRDTIDDAKAWAEPLAESTVKKKGHDRPLVDSEVMRKSASWAIRRHGQAVEQGGEE